MANHMDDMLMGTAMDDVLWGGPGDDTLQGGSGDDRLIGGPGADALDGGAGSDTADYAMSDAGVHVDLSSTFGRNDDDDRGPVHSGHAEGDSLQSIENIWGSSYGDKLIGNHVANMLFGRGGNDEIMGGRGDDSIWGHAGADLLMGERGDDMLYGGSDDDLIEGGDGNDILMGQAGDDVLEGDDGNDILEGGMGADELDGGDGSDTAAYTMSEEGVTINLGNVGTARPVATGGDAMGDTLMSIENVRGSMHDDMLTGDGEDNKLYGNQGDDELMGGAGDDMLRGGMGDDELDGGTGDDMIYGDKGDDTLTGDDGKDTFVFREDDGDDVIEDFESGEDMIKLGTSKLTDSQIRQVLNSEDDNPDETYTYQWEDTSFTVDVRLTAADFSNKAEQPNVLDDDGEEWPGDGVSNRGDDEVLGGAGDDEIDGGRGDDTLRGNAGNDELTGGRGDDTLEGGRGDDMLMGGDGRDDLVGDRGDDTLVGGNSNDMLTGGRGDDRFEFDDSDGSDTITDFGEYGDDDVIALGSGPLPMEDIEDILDDAEYVGGGNYRYEWEDTTFTVNKRLTASDFEMEPRRDKVELDDSDDDWGNATDMDADDYNGGNDYVDGDGGEDEIRGGKGNDTLKGGDDNDDLKGEDGADMLYGNSGMDMLSGGKGNDTLMGGTDNDTLMGGEGDDELTGDGGADKLEGGDGSDKLNADLDDVKADLLARLATQATDGSFDLSAFDASMVGTLNGGDGTDDDEDDMDTLSFEGSEMGISVVTTADVPTTPADETVTAQYQVHSSFEKVIGSNNADKLTLGAAGELMGGGGHDMLSARASTTDTPPVHFAAKLMGGDGNDTLTGGDGNDTLMGGDDNDSLMGGGGNDRLDGGGGKDTLTGGEGDDVFVWGRGDTAVIIVDTTTGEQNEDKIEIPTGLLTGVEGVEDLDADYLSVSRESATSEKVTVTLDLDGEEGGQVQTMVLQFADADTATLFLGLELSEQADLFMIG